MSHVINSIMLKKKDFKLKSVLINFVVGGRAYL